MWGIGACDSRWSPSAGRGVSTACANRSRGCGRDRSVDDRVILLNKGVKMDEGNPKEIVDLYKKLLVHIEDGGEGTEGENSQEELSPEEQEARRFLGMEIAIEHVQEKISLPIKPEDLFVAIRAGLTGSQLGELAKLFKELGFDSMKPLADYFNCNLDDATRAKVEGALSQVLKKEDARLDAVGVNERLDSLDVAYKQGVAPEQMKPAVEEV